MDTFQFVRKHAYAESMVRQVATDENITFSHIKQKCK